MALIKPATDKIPNGPIPGENYTSDTKNYPWHRPPDITNLDDGIEAIAKQLSTKESVFSVLNALEMGMTVVQAATMVVLSGIGAGKWTVDFAILLAGPTAKLIQILADKAGIKYQMGLEDDPIPTSTFFKAVKNIDTEDVKIAGEAMNSAVPGIEKEAQKLQMGGFMAANSPVPASKTAQFQGGFA